MNCTAIPFDLTSFRLTGLIRGIENKKKRRKKKKKEEEEEEEQEQEEQEEKRAFKMYQQLLTLSLDITQSLRESTLEMSVF